MNLFKRLFKFGSAEAHSALDQLEDPIKMSEQAIRDLRSELDKAMQNLAEVKAIVIRTQREKNSHLGAAEDYKTRAMRLLQKGQDGDLDSAEADRLAGEALERQGEEKQKAARAGQENEKYEQLAANLEHKIQELKAQITQWENELKTLKARARVSEATTRINKQMAQIDSSSTIATLEKMRSRVEEQEALAESYGDMAAPSRNLDSEIDAALRDDTGGQALADLKAQMGIDRNRD